MFGIVALVPTAPARPPIPAALQPWLSTMVASPTLTWAALLIGIPFAVSAVRRAAPAGPRPLWGRRAVACPRNHRRRAPLRGLDQGPWAWERKQLGPRRLSRALSFFTVGACVGLSYWLGQRLAASHLVGLAWPEISRHR
jgi:hypothetical protein